MLAAVVPHVTTIADRAIATIIRALSHVLIPMFIVGMAGSTLVVAITFVHDLFDFFSSEGENDLPTADNIKTS